MNLRALMVLFALWHASGMGLHANDAKPVLQLDFGQDEGGFASKKSDPYRLDVPGPR